MAEAINHEGVSYRRSRRAKNLRITIKPSQAVTVTVPYHVPMAEAHDFVLSKQRWIQKHLDKLRRSQQITETLPVLSEAQLQDIQEQLFERLEQFSKRYDLPYHTAAFRCQKTKWGSCSSQNNISLNINLAYLPEVLQDYVLLHELCHVRYKNHGKAFWGLLDQVCGDKARQYAKTLCGYGMRIQT